MLIVAKNAEKEFLTQLTTYAKEEPAMRCLHLGFSTLERKEDRHEWLPEFLSSYERFIDERFFHVFICSDGDLLIFSRTLTFRRLSQFLTHLTPKLMPAPAKELASLFEIGVDLKKIAQTVRQKIEKAQSQAEQKKPESTEIETVSEQKMFNEIDAQLIANLGSRRSARESIEILVVEDDMLSQRLVHNSLSSSFPITMCDEGARSILQYVTKAPDVVFLDIGLPDMDGHDVLEKIFSIDPDAFVVMFSGNGSKENILKALQSGAKGFVGKPFSKDKLVQYINRSPHILNKKRGRKEDGYTVH